VRINNLYVVEYKNVVHDCIFEQISTFTLRHHYKLCELPHKVYWLAGACQDHTFRDHFYSMYRQDVR